MSIANVSTDNTFYEEMVSLNAVITEMNRQTDGIYVTLGNLTILNSATASQLGLNVHSGGIRTNFIEIGPGSSGYPSLTHKGTGNSNSGIYFAAANTMRFVTAGNDVVSIVPAGNVGIGTTAPTQKLDVLGRVNVTGISAFTGNVGIFKSQPNVALDVVGSIWATGNITMESDFTTKSDISPLRNSVLLVSALQGVTYTQIATGAQRIGLVAQEVKKVLPQVVSENDGLLGVNYPVLTALLIEAVKELTDRIARLEKK